MLLGENFSAEVQGDILRSHGIDWGRPLKIVFRKGKKLVVRREGHSSWAGRFSLRDYSGTLYMLVELGSERISKASSLNGKAFTRTYALILAQANPGRKWKPVLADLIEKAKER